eukprot:411911-Prorocentrum_minimum.AAC.1
MALFAARIRLGRSCAPRTPHAHTGLNLFIHWFTSPHAILVARASATTRGTRVTVAFIAALHPTPL